MIYIRRQLASAVRSLINDIAEDILYTLPDLIVILGCLNYWCETLQNYNLSATIPKRQTYNQTITMSL